MEKLTDLENHELLLLCDKFNWKERHMKVREVDSVPRCFFARF